MKKLAMCYEGKAKKIFKTDDDECYIVEYKDDATAFNGLKKGRIAGKGIVNNKLSSILFEMLERAAVPTHFIERLSEREQLVKAVEILPLEVIIRNTIAGSMAKRLGLVEGRQPACTILEFCYKNDDLGDPLINDDHAVALGLATREQIAVVRHYAFQINDLLKVYFADKGLRLIDFKLEFGLFKGNVILADEISPDTCRLWDIETGRKMDKDRFRSDLGDVEATYQDVLGRLQ